LVDKNITNLAKAKAERKLYDLASSLVSRAKLAERAGLSYFPSSGGSAKRDLFNALGYPKTAQFNDMLWRVTRGDIGKRILEAPVRTTWRKKPALIDDANLKAGEASTFAKAWDDLVLKRKVWHYIQRADKVSGIGRYGVLLVGLNDKAGNSGSGDGGPLSAPVGKASELLYLQVFNENNASIETWEDDIQSERYGLPKTYKLKFRDPKAADGKSGMDRTVHYSRLIHIAEDLTDNDVYGTPRLEIVLNRLMNLDLIAGGSAEMFWRGAFPGYALNMDSGTDVETMDTDDLEEQIQAFVHNLERYVKLQGIDMKALTSEVADPSNHFNIQIDLISAATGIPKRILLGSERGELASSQDERNWLTRIDERRHEHAEPMILRPLVDLLIDVEVLPQPKEDNYDVVWPDLIVTSEKDQADIGKLKSEALSKYVMSPGAEEVLPPDFFYRKILGLTDDEVDDITEMLEAEIDEVDGLDEPEPIPGQEE